MGTNPRYASLQTLSVSSDRAADRATLRACRFLALTTRSLHCGDSVRFVRYLLRGEGSMRTPAFDSERSSE